MTVLKRTVLVSLPGVRDREVFERVLPRELAPHTTFSPDGKSAVITSPDFLKVPDPDFNTFANDLLGRLAALAHVYGSNAPVEWSVARIVEDRIDKKGHSTRTFTFNVVAGIDGAAIASLHEPLPDGETKLDRLLRLAETDRYVKRALGLLSSYPDWRGIYDVIAFVRERGVKLSKRTARIKQTANHFRHLGEDGYELPDDPPSLGESRQHSLELLRDWLNRRAME